MADGDFKSGKGMNSILLIGLVFLAAFGGALVANFFTKHVITDVTGKFLAEARPRLNASKTQTTNPL